MTSPDELESLINTGRGVKPWKWVESSASITISDELYREVFGELFQVQPTRWERLINRLKELLHVSG